MLQAVQAAPRPQNASLVPGSQTLSVVQQPAQSAVQSIDWPQLFRTVPHWPAQVVPSGSGVQQACSWQTCDDGQETQPSPFLPHAPLSVPASHVAPSQQPAQPLQAIVPPQPSSAAPHVWPVGQVVAGVQPQTPFVPPPPQTSWPVQPRQAWPPVPQRASDCWVTRTHVSPSQQPFAQLVGSQTHWPRWQRWPSA
ncbi:MAG TPA: hypothetical protein VFU81_16985, partial [Thermomicrobiales bacterium]|nr:hypothetical protein [Thermomicrobiales bacterium]